MQPYDQVFPLLRGAVAWRGQFLSLRAGAHWIRYQDDAMREWQAAIGVHVFAPMSVYVGWRDSRYDLAATDYRLDARLSGPTVLIGLDIP